jgi:hypothetical protein
MTTDSTEARPKRRADADAREEYKGAENRGEAPIDLKERSAYRARQRLLLGTARRRPPFPLGDRRRSGRDCG